MATNLSSKYPVSVPTTQSWDPGQIYTTEVNSPEFKDLIVKMYQQLNLIATVLNFKETGQYNNSFETVSSKFWFPNPIYNSSTRGNATDRPGLRTVYLFSLPPGLLTLPHDLAVTPAWTFIEVYGMANDTVNFHYYIIGSSGTVDISATLDNINIYITNNTGFTFNICYLVVEYLKS